MLSGFESWEVVGVVIVVIIVRKSLLGASYLINTNEE